MKSRRINFTLLASISLCILLAGCRSSQSSTPLPDYNLDDLLNAVASADIDKVRLVLSVAPPSPSFESRGISAMKIAVDNLNAAIATGQSGVDEHEIVRELLKAGSDPYEVILGNNLFSTLVYFDYFLLAQHMLDSGYDINVIGPKILGMPLRGAATPEQVRFLLQNGADPNLAVPGSYEPVLVGHGRAASRLAENYVRMQTRANNTSASSDLLRSQGELLINQFSIMSLLVANGADIKAQSRDGRTAYDFVSQYEGKLPPSLIDPKIFNDLCVDR